MNQINVQSSITINKTNISTLCFVDGLFIPKSQYSLENHELTIYKESEQSIDLYYTKNIIPYVFEAFLQESGVVISGVDLQKLPLIGVTENNIMIFVNGILLNKNQYKVLDDKNIALLISFPTLKQISKISICVFPEDLQHTIIQATPGGTIQHGYNNNISMLFVNGKKLSQDKIMSISKTQFAINASYDINSDVVELYTLPLKATECYGFVGEKGYLTYGPYDTNHNKLPLYHDTEIMFSDLAYLLVDNIRTGMYIKESNGTGSAILVDDNYQSNTIKAIALTSFVKNNLAPGEFHIESPSYKSICDYMSEYDKSKQMLPEILDVFQRFLIDEFRDSVDRIKDMRSLSKVDSKNIGKLIKLLGVNFDIKRLNLKQKKELLGELNEFYRIVGTKNSYNLFNILQDSTRIIDINQLFTPLDSSIKAKNPNYIYKYVLENAGDGYRPGEQYVIAPTDLSITIKEVATPEGVEEKIGPIKRFSYGTFEGTIDYKAITSIEGNLLPLAKGAMLSIDSRPCLYDYEITVHTNNASFLEGVPLYNDKYKLDGVLGEIIIKDGAHEGDLTSEEFNASITEGADYIEINNEPLNTKSSQNEINSAILNINSKNNKLIIDDIKFDIYPGEKEDTFVLEPGVYHFDLIGGGGAGGESVNGKSGGAGATSIPAMYDIIIDKKVTCSYKVGQGGKTKANGGNGGAGGGTIIYFWGKEIVVDRESGGPIIGGAGGGGGYPTYVYFSSDVKTTSGQTIRRIICQGGGGGGGAGGQGLHGRYADSGHGGGGGGYYHMNSDGTLLNYSGQMGGKNGGDDDGDGSNGRKGNTAIEGFSTIKAGSGGRGSHNYDRKLRGYGGSGGVGGGASGGGGGGGAGNHSTASSGAGGGGAGGSLLAGGGEGGYSDVFDGNGHGQNGYNFRVTPVEQFDTYYTSTKISYGLGGTPDNDGSDGMLRVRKWEQHYSGLITWEKYADVLFAPGDVVYTPDRKFTATISSVTDTSANVVLSPSYGYQYVSLQYPVVSSVSVTIKSTPKLYNYLHYISGIQECYADGMVFNSTVQYAQLDKNEQPIEGAPNKSQVFSVKIDKTANGAITSSTLLSPTQGTDCIRTSQGFDTQVEHGERGIVSITSTQNYQKDNERTYVDFYRKDEYPGHSAELKKSYVSDKEDYGLVSEGSPASPYPWAPQDADEDYGDGATLITGLGPTGEVTAEDYGLVTENIDGHWEEYWIWDRPSGAYATNHVEVEINILAGENYDETIERFYRQFYNLASTVLYIHRLTTVFNFGENTLGNSNVNENTQRISMGIMSAPYALYEKHFCSSDPIYANGQYI